MKIQAIQTWIFKLLTTVSLSSQAKYDDIKKVVKAAADGPMKGILGYTDHQVFTRLQFFCKFFLLEFLIIVTICFPAGRLHRLQRWLPLLNLWCWCRHRSQRTLCQARFMVSLRHWFTSLSYPCLVMLALFLLQGMTMSTATATVFVTWWPTWPLRSKPSSWLGDATDPHSPVICDYLVPSESRPFHHLLRNHPT